MHRDIWNTYSRWIRVGLEVHALSNRLIIHWICRSHYACIHTNISCMHTYTVLSVYMYMYKYDINCKKDGISPIMATKSSFCSLTGTNIVEFNAHKHKLTKNLTNTWFFAPGSIYIENVILIYHIAKAIFSSYLLL